MTPADGDKTMSFWEHLDELRSRMIRMVLAFTAGAGVSWAYREQILAWVSYPFVQAWKSGRLGAQASLHFAAPADLFMAYLKLSLLGGFVLALPLILQQVWAFVAPGLYAREKRYAVPFVLTSTLLFAVGGGFGFMVAFPVAFTYLLGLSGPVSEGFAVIPTVMVTDYLDFVVRLLLVFGAIFELPVLVFFLALAGLVTHQDLLRFWRYFVVIAFVFGAIFSPPDIASQLLVAVPLCLLYGVSIGVAYVFGRERQPPRAPQPPTPAG
jgi:sec-independent protein translocase protein TatC